MAISDKNISCRDCGSTFVFTVGEQEFFAERGDPKLAGIQLADEVKRVDRERKETEQRLKRLGQVYLDNLTTPEEYRRQKRLLEDRIQGLVVPGVDAVEEAGKLLELL